MRSLREEFQVATGGDPQFRDTMKIVIGLEGQFDSYATKISHLVKNIYHTTLVSEAAQVLLGTTAKDKKI